MIRFAIGMVIAVVSAFLALYYYCGWEGGRTTLGFNVSNLVFGVLFTAVITLPWTGIAVAVRMVADHAVIHQRGRRRMEASACATCGYAETAALAICPECGRAPVAELNRKKVLVRAAIGAFILCIVGIATGVIGGEAWLLLDESAFRREAERLRISNGAPTAHYRPRWWPGRNNGLIYDPGSGYRGED